MASRLKIYKGNNVKRFNWGRVVKRGLKEGVKEIEKEEWEVISTLLGFEGVKEARSPGNLRESYLLFWA